MTTIPRMARPRGEVTPAQLRRLLAASRKAREADEAMRATFVAVLTEGASFAELSKETGVSTNTLQRWKREAQS